MKERTVVLIGHRHCPALNPKFLSFSLELLIRFGYTQFLCGGMGEFDSLCAKLIHHLRQTSYPHVHTCFVPHKPSAHPPDISLFNRIIAPLDLDHLSNSQKITQRNRFMVDLADFALCYVIRDQGGAATTLRYACQEPIPVANLGTYKIK